MSELVETGGGELLSSPVPLPADRNPAAVYLASLGSERSRRAMLGRLQFIARLLGADDPLTIPWQNLRYQHAAAIRARLIESGQAPTTVNLALSALRGVAREAFNLGLLGAEDYQRLRQVRSVRGSRLPAGRSLTHGELAALMEICANDDSNSGARDAAIIGVMYTGGLRREEVPALDLEDYDRDTGEIRVTGKGDKQRRVYINDGTEAALGDWLTIRGQTSGPLFLPLTRGGHVQWRRMNPQTVYDMLARRAAQAGVRPFTPHDLRRTFVGDLLDAGADVVTVQALAGHANVQTTARYDRRPEEVKRRAASLLHLPYRGRDLTRGR